MRRRIGRGTSRPALPEALDEPSSEAAQAVPGQAPAGRSLLNLPPESWPGQGYRRRQLLEWVFRRGETRFEAMSNLPQAWRQELAGSARLATFRSVAEHPSADGAIRFLITLDDSRLTESVLMPYADRTTVCLSSMVGCPAGCTFCATGALGFGRNLSRGEILEQLLVAARAAGMGPGQVSNLVFMGMGEPLLNYEEFMGAVRTMVHGEGLGFSPRRITVSTVGLPAGIRRLAQENLPLRLAISLHAPDDAIRRRLMPVADRHEVAEIMAAAEEYFTRTGRRITFEYTLIGGENDSPAQADLLARRVRGVAAHVNLIPLNEWPGSALQRPPAAVVQAFARRLRERGVNATVRHSRGQDAGAACGQLAAGGAGQAAREAPRRPSRGPP